MRWVSQRIAAALSAYAQWEETLGETFHDLDDTAESTLTDLPGTLNVQVLDAPDSALFARADAQGDDAHLLSPPAR